MKSGLVRSRFVVPLGLAYRSDTAPALALERSRFVVPSTNKHLGDATWPYNALAVEVAAGVLPSQVDSFLGYRACKRL